MRIGADLVEHNLMIENKEINKKIIHMIVKLLNGYSYKFIILLKGFKLILMKELISLDKEEYKFIKKFL